MDTPLVTILVPVYNCEPYLDQCITSIINQDYKNLQIILSNDGSTDNSLEICRSYASKDSRIMVLVDRNQGVSTTRNRLLELIEGDYFLFVDADDWIEPDMVGYLSRLIGDYNADMAVCSVIHTSKSTESDQTELEILVRREAIEKFLYHKDLNGSLCNKLIKTSLIKNNKFDPNIYYGEDALFIWGILQNINRIVKSDKQLYNYRPNPVSLSHNSWTPERKGTGYKVWDRITLETVNQWPEFKDIADSRFALECMWAIYFASLSDYPYDAEIKLRQKAIRKRLRALSKVKIDGLKRFFTALALAFYYPSGKFVKTILHK